MQLHNDSDALKDDIIIKDAVVEKLRSVVDGERILKHHRGGKTKNHEMAIK
jgi:hypothetical protein